MLVTVKMGISGIFPTGGLHSGERMEMLSFEG